MCHNLRKSISYVILLALLGACASNSGNEKTQTGASVGAIVGALLGAGASNKENRLAGAAFGAALGGGIGYMIGQRLDARDQASLKQKIEELASAEATGKTIWRSQHSGASADVDLSEPTRMTEQSRRISAESDVQVEGKALTSAAERQVATQRVNVRSGPGTEYPSKFILPAGRVVDVVGKSDGGWQLIMEKGVAVGYVSDVYLRSAENTAQQSKKSQGAEPTTLGSKPSVEAPVRTANSTHEVDVRVATQCKQVRVRVRTNDGKISEESVETCRRPDGTWGS